MKFQNPSLNSVLNGRKDERTNGRTDKPKPICSPLFQSWGHNQNGVRHRLGRTIVLLASMRLVGCSVHLK